jgi:hypothetical protein
MSFFTKTYNFQCRVISLLLLYIQELEFRGGILSRFLSLALEARSVARSTRICVGFHQYTRYYLRAGQTDCYLLRWGAEQWHKFHAQFEPAASLALALASQPLTTLEQLKPPRPLFCTHDFSCCPRSTQREGRIILR